MAEANTEQGVAPGPGLLGGLPDSFSVRLMNPQEVALALQVSTRTLERYRAANTGPAFVKLAADKVAYFEHSVVDWLAEKIVLPEKRRGMAEKASANESIGGA